jgi:hypothetical protein
MDSVVHDFQYPFCKNHPSSECNYKFGYCKDCGDDTRVVLRKDQDTNFVCLACNEEEKNATHVNHFIVSVSAYM